MLPEGELREASALPERGLVTDLARHAVSRLLSNIGNPPLAVVVGNGEELSPSQPAVARVRIRDGRTAWKLAMDPLFEFGEAYADGRIEVEGDLVELLTVAAQTFEAHESGRRITNRLLQLMRRPRANSLAGSRQNITHHYDIGNDFYRLWLDENLVYTCAYFPRPQLSLEQAQHAKMEHVCRKLRLAPGQQVLEAGCGWGALALHMAEHYGVRVKAFNISHEQICHARHQARQKGLADRVEFIEDDWRSMHEPCDAFVSVGMLEHVGRSNYGRLGEVIHRCLKSQGNALVHSIGKNRAEPLNPWIERRIFPGAYPPTLYEMADVFEPHGFSILDVENLRLHYAATLRHWRGRFERAADEVREMFDEQFVRMWRFYLCSSISAFETGGLQLFQIVFARGNNNDVPWTREHLYAAGPHDA